MHCTPSTPPAIAQLAREAAIKAKKLKASEKKQKVTINNTPARAQVVGYYKLE